MIYTFTVPALPPASQSPNSRVHWRVKHRDRVEFMEVCALAILGAGGKDWQLERVRAGLEFVCTVGRRRDEDNWQIRGSKPIGDTLVQMGILPDDDREHLTWLPPEFRVDTVRGSATIVRMQEWPW